MNTVDPPTEPAARSLRSAVIGGRPADSVEVARLAAAVGSHLFAVRRSFSIAGYRIQRPVGEGASGVVYEAVDPTGERAVALKLLRTRDPEEVERVRHEADVLGRLQHPDIVRVHDVGVEASESGEGQRAFIVTELVHGTDIVSWCMRRPPALRPAVAIAAARAIASAHRVAIVHCDIKPEHLLVDADGKLTVIDFGLAQARPTDHDGDRKATAHVRIVVGTPGYAAPEVWAGSPCDERSDQFSLCVTLWEALLGRHPFGAAGLERLVRIAEGRPESARRGERRLAAVLARGLAHDPNRRWPGLEDLANALQSASLQPRRRWWIAVATVVVALAAIAAMFAGASP